MFLGRSDAYISMCVAVIGGLFTDVNGPGDCCLAEDERQKNQQCVGALFEISGYLFLSRVSDDTLHDRRMAYAVVDAIKRSGGNGPASCH